MGDLGQRLDALMRKRDLTQAELARKLGVSRSRVWHWIRAGRFPSRAVWPKLAKILGTTVGELIARESP